MIGFKPRASSFISMLGGIFKIAEYLSYKNLTRMEIIIYFLIP